MKWIEQMPLRRRLTTVILVVCGSALVTAFVALLSYERGVYRRLLAADSIVMADVIGGNSRAALAFDDEAAGTAVLRALESEPRVAAAAVYGRGGQLFASYVRPGALLQLADHPGADGARFDPAHLVVFRPVIQNEKRIGTIFLAAGLEGIDARLRLFGGMAALVLVGALVVALVLSGWLQRLVTGPILALTETAALIAERKDYSVRAHLRAGSEIGTLAEAFNSVLAGIEERQRALHEANDALREEVAERRRAETRVQAQLERLAQLSRITRAVGERQDAESIFQAVVRSLEEQMPADFTCVCLLDATGEALVLTKAGVRSEDLTRQMSLPVQSRIPIDQNGLKRCIGGQLAYDPDVSQIATPFPQKLAGAGLRSVVLAPLIVESKVFGVLIVARRAAADFTSGDCEFLRQLSEHVALAAHQAQLYSALQTAYEDLRQTQQIAMQQERLRALGQMASGVAHDINNAISPISLYVESMLEQEPGLSAQGREWLEVIGRAIDDVTQTVARLREFYRQREPQLALSSVPLNRVIEQVAELTRVRWCDMPQQRGTVIELKKDLAPNLPAVMAVESETREALINLVFNAVDAMADGGILTLRTKTLERRRRDNSATLETIVAVEVIDTGCGMDEETQRRCMEPFFTTKGDRGTGLGLAMVYGIARRHGADLEIDSVPGRGTTVRLLFAAAAATATPGRPVAAPRPVNRLRLLIVDDDPTLLKSLRDTLEADGHAITTANGGQAGINTFLEAKRKDELFDAVITDLGMPYIDGRKVASAVKGASRETRVIMLTGWGQRMRDDGEIPPDVDRMLSKPPKLRELREALAAIGPA